MKLRLVIFAVILLFQTTLQSKDVSLVFTLPVRVHLMRSTMHTRLQATFTEEKVRAVFEEVNVIWAQAGIRFEVEAIDHLEAIDVAPKKWFEKDRNWVKLAIPTDHFSSTAIDVCFVREMGPNGFFYGEPVVVCEEPEFTKVKGGADNPVARVTAHELGHVLGLQHRQDHTNLMASARNGFSLNNQEIKDARIKAREISVAWSIPPQQP